jgi:hypothetical protein
MAREGGGEGTTLGEGGGGGLRGGGEKEEKRRAMWYMKETGKDIGKKEASRRLKGEGEKHRADNLLVNCSVVYIPSSLFCTLHKLLKSCC